MNSQNSYKPKIKSQLLIATTILGVALSFSSYSQARVSADNTASDLRSKTATLEEKIADNQKKLQSLERKSDTLRDRIAALKTEISIASDKIDLTNQKIAQLKIEVEKAQKELERQEALLAESLRALYKQGHITTIELLAASDSYTEFINEQEYLERLKGGIQESAEKVEKLKLQLEDQKAEQESLLAEQEQQRQVLQEKTEEQSELLRKTEGQESKYRKVIEDLEEQRAQAEQALKDYLASLIRENLTSLGRVAKGTKIGLVGTTGFSTGPHLHFAVTDGSTFFNPVSGSNSLAYGFQWPLPNSSWSNVTQSYGCVAPSDWYLTKCNNGQNSFHSGLDISGWYGDPIVAAADGDIIFRGWMGGYGNTVIIDHGNGLYTYYPHMLE